MSNKNTKYIEPRLRFPEFRDTNEWEKKTLLEVCKKITQGGTPDTTNSSFWNGHIEWLTPAEMGKTESYVINSTKRKITSEGLRNCSSELLPINSVILSTRAPIGHLAINSTEMAINQGCKGLIPKESTDYKFLYYVLYYLKSCLINLGAGNTFKELSGSVLKKFNLSLPTYREQQKIADCLSSIDELITAESKKLDALKTYKKGLMQQLFPTEGETLPKLRFPEFKDSGSWEKIRIIDLASKDVKWSFTGGPFGSNLKSSDYTNTGIRVIQLQNIGDGEFVDNYKIYTSENKANELLSCNIYPGEIILSKMGDPVARACLIPDKEKRYVMCSDGIRLAVDKNKFDNYFIYSFINSEIFRVIAEKSSTGSTRKRIGLDILKNLKIMIPTIQEQQKIANTLYLLDDFIANQSKKMDALKNHKKGLMQQLFPTMSEL